jgi:hypothetical protein
MPNKQDENETVKKIAELIASRIMVECAETSEYPCPHAQPIFGYEKCPHLDEDICMWQRGQAKDIATKLYDAGLDFKKPVPELTVLTENPCDNCSFYQNNITFGSCKRLGSKCHAKVRHDAYVAQRDHCQKEINNA